MDWERYGIRQLANLLGKPWPKFFWDGSFTWIYLFLPTIYACSTLWVLPINLNCLYLLCEVYRFHGDWWCHSPPKKTINYDEKMASSDRLLGTSCKTRSKPSRFLSPPSPWRFPGRSAEFPSCFGAARSCHPIPPSCHPIPPSCHPFLLAKFCNSFSPPKRKDGALKLEVLKKLTLSAQGSRDVSTRIFYIVAINYLCIHIYLYHVWYLCMYICQNIWNQRCCYLISVATWKRCFPKYIWPGSKHHRKTWHSEILPRVPRSSEIGPQTNNIKKAANDAKIVTSLDDMDAFPTGPKHHHH